MRQLFMVLKGGNGLKIRSANIPIYKIGVALRD